MRSPARAGSRLVSCFRSLVIGGVLLLAPIERAAGEPPGCRTLVLGVAAGSALVGWFLASHPPILGENLSAGNKVGLIASTASAGAVLGYLACRSARNRAPSRGSQQDVLEARTDSAPTSVRGPRVIPSGLRLDPPLSGPAYRATILQLMQVRYRASQPG